jgi:3-methyladenine DNA glycosylase Tag
MNCTPLAKGAQIMNEPQSLTELPASVVQAIDRMVDRVSRFKVDPEFSRQIDERSSTRPNFAMDDREVLRHLMVLIAYSNNANSLKVTRLVESDVFESIFQNYFIKNWTHLSAEGASDGGGNTTTELAKTIVNEHWLDLTAIRFKYKVEAWTRCAKCLQAIHCEYGSFMTYLKGTGLPSILQSECDIQVFWDCFDKIRNRLLQEKFPYFANFTSLCHLLLHVGFDCAKPDLIVMKSAVGLGIVPQPPKKKSKPSESGTHPERSLRKTVRTMQAYAVQKGIRVPVIDLYFLIHGKQADAIALVKPEYYDERQPCSSSASDSVPLCR